MISESLGIMRMIPRPRRASLPSLLTDPSAWRGAGAQRSPEISCELTERMLVSKIPANLKGPMK